MPPRFSVGATLQFSTTLAAYPASAGWVLSHRLVRRAGDGVISFAATASGDAHLTTVAAATTAAWAPGAYTWANWVTRSGEVYDIDTGLTTLLADPRTASASLDLRTEAQIALDNVRATVAGKATADVLSYEINGRRLQRYPMAELIALERHLAERVAREARAVLIAAGKADPRRYTVRLGRA